jgi:hypothetical protein
MPTSTDLVTDLPADFEVFGQAVDTQMKTNADAATQKATLTTKGDIYAATGTSTPARLAVGGTNGHVLTVDSSTATGLKYAAVAGGSLTLLSTTTISGSATVISAISQSYKNLYIEIEDINAATAPEPNFRLNGDASNHYFRHTRSTTNETSGGGNTVISVYDNEYVINTDNIFALTIFNYASTTTVKSFTFCAGWSDAGPTLTGTNGGGFYNSTSAITSLSVRDSISLTGGTVRIYGVN